MMKVRRFNVHRFEGWLAAILSHALRSIDSRGPRQAGSDPPGPEPAVAASMLRAMARS